MTDRRRNTMILLVVAGLIAASAAAIASKTTRLGLDLKGGIELIYQAKPTAQSKVSTESLERAISIMRTRVDQIGVSQPEIQRSGKDEIDVVAARRAQRHPGRSGGRHDGPAELLRLGAQRDRAQRQTRTDQRRRHGDSTSEGAGGVTAGLTQYQAVLRAAKRPAILRGSDTTWTPGCTPEQKNDCIYGTWYLLDTVHETVVRGPEETEGSLFRSRTAARRSPSCVDRAKLKSVRVNPGTVVVQAHPVESESARSPIRAPTATTSSTTTRC